MRGLTKRSKNTVRCVKGPLAMHKRGAKGTSVQYLDRATAALALPRGVSAHFLATFADAFGATHHRWVPCTTRFSSLFAHSCEALEHKLGWRLVEKGAVEEEVAASEGDEFAAAILFLLSLPCSLPQKAVAFTLGVGVKRLHKLLGQYYAVDQEDANELWPAVLEALPAGQLQRQDAAPAHSLASDSFADTQHDGDDESELPSGGSSSGGSSTATRMRRASGALGARSAGVRQSAALASKRSASSAATSIQSRAAQPLVSNSICSANGQPAPGLPRTSRSDRPVAGQGRGKDLLLIRSAFGDLTSTVTRRRLPVLEDVTPAAAGGGKHAGLLSPAVDLPPGQHRRYMAQLELLMKQATAREKQKKLEAGASPGVAAAEAAAWLRAHQSELRATALARALQGEGEGCVGPLCPVHGCAEGGPPLLPTTSNDDAAAEADRMALETGLRNSLLEQQARVALSSAPPGVDATAHAREQLQAVKPALLAGAEWRAEAIAEQERSAAWALDPTLQPAPPPARGLRPMPAPKDIVPCIALPEAILPVGAAEGGCAMMAAPALTGGREGPELARDPSLGPANTMASAQSCALLCDWEHGLPPAIRSGQIMLMDCDE